MTFRPTQSKVRIKPGRWLAGLLLWTAAAHAQGGPDRQPCPVDWHGITLQQAVDELALRLDAPVIPDQSITSSDLAAEIRLSASHLTGVQVARWAARSAGLEAVAREGAIFVAKPDRMPETWRFPAGPAPEDDTQWRSMANRQSAVSWVDVPGSAVASDISANFGVDLVIHPTVLSAGELIYYQSPTASLREVCRLLSERLHAEVSLYDGALWARPIGLTKASESKPIGESSTRAARTGPQEPREPADGTMARLIHIDRAVGNWSDLGELITRSTDLRCTIKVPPGCPPPRWEARGALCEVLEAGRLLGLLSYRLDPQGAKMAQPLLIQVVEADRYPR